MGYSMSLLKIEKQAYINQVKGIVADELKEFNRGIKGYFNRVCATTAAKALVGLPLLSTVPAAAFTAIAATGLSSSFHMTDGYIWLALGAVAGASISAATLLMGGPLDEPQFRAEKIVKSFENELLKINPGLTKKEMGQIMEFGCKELSNEMRKASSIPGSKNHVDKALNYIEILVQVQAEKYIDPEKAKETERMLRVISNSRDNEIKDIKIDPDSLIGKRYKKELSFDEPSR